MFQYSNLCLKSWKHLMMNYYCMITSFEFLTFFLLTLLLFFLVSIYSSLLECIQTAASSPTTPSNPPPYLACTPVPFLSLQKIESLPGTSAEHSIPRCSKTRHKPSDSFCIASDIILNFANTTLLLTKRPRML